MKRLLLLSINLLYSSFVFSFGVTWEGLLTDNADNPDSNAGRAITLKLYDSDKSCLLYQEDHSVDTSLTNGRVSLVLGTGTPSGGSGAIVDDMFNNAFLQNCVPSGTEAMGLVEERKLEVIVEGETLNPDLDIPLLPSAVYSKQASIAKALDPNAVVTASITDQSITDIKMAGIAANCGNGDVLKTDGAGNFSCAADNIGGDLQADGSVPMTANFDAGTNKIVSLADPTNLDDAATKNYVDNAVTGVPTGDFLRHDGGNPMTANLDAGTNKIINLVDPTALTDGATKNYVDNAVAGVPTGDFLRHDGGNPMTANLDAGTNKIINLVDPTALTDGATKNYVDNAVAGVPTGDFLRHDGGNPMTADLDAGTNKIINLVDPTALTDGATKNYVDNAVAGVPTGDFLRHDGGNPMTADLDAGTNKIINLVDPTALTDGATKNYVDNAVAGVPTGDFLRHDGGNPMTADLDAGTNKIINLVDPTALTDAATKNYVDGLIGGQRDDTNTAIGPIFDFTKTRSNFQVNADDELGGLEFSGFDTGASPVIAASIKAEVDDVVGSADVPGRIIFNTREPAAGPLTTRMAIMSSGKVHAGAIHGDTNTPPGGFGCTFDGVGCHCNDGFTFTDFDQNGLIDTDECVEPGLVADPNDGVNINGGLYVGAEQNYNATNPGGDGCTFDGGGCRCHDGFTFDDLNNNNQVDVSQGECVRFGIDASGDHVQIGSSFSIGQFGDPNAPIGGFGCPFNGTSCTCNSGYQFLDKNSNGTIETGECSGAILSSSQKHGGTSFGSYEDPQGREFGAPDCSPDPGTCACFAGSFWNDLNGNGGIGDNECYKGGVTVMGVLGIGTDRPTERLHIQGTSFFDGETRKISVSNNSGDAVKTIYLRAKGSPGAETAVGANDVISEQTFRAHNGSNFTPSAKFSVVGNGPAGAHVPARMEFFTSDGSNPPQVRMIVMPTGEVGFGTTAPQATVHIDNVMKIEPHPDGGSPRPCTGPPDKGLIAYNDGINLPCHCNGTAWQTFTGGACGSW